MENSSNPLIYLASASPRRSALLDQIGVPHRVQPVDVDESRARRRAAGPIRPPACGAQGRNAVAEACRSATRSRCSARTRLSSWTTRSWANRAIEQDCLRMLGCCRRARIRCSPRSRCATSDGCESRVNVSDVTFRELARRRRSGATGARASPRTRPAPMQYRAARRSSSSASPAATRESWVCRCSRPASCWPRSRVHARGAA